MAAFKFPGRAKNSMHAALRSLQHVFLTRNLPAFIESKLQSCVPNYRFGLQLTVKAQKKQGITQAWKSQTKTRRKKPSHEGIRSLSLSSRCHQVPNPITHQTLWLSSSSCGPPHLCCSTSIVSNTLTGEIGIFFLNAILLLLVHKSRMEKKKSTFSQLSMSLPRWWFNKGNNDLDLNKLINKFGDPDMHFRSLGIQMTHTAKFRYRRCILLNKRK